MIIVELDEKSYAYLIQILNEKFYQTTQLTELSRINEIYKQLKFKSESWLEIPNT